MTGHRCPAELLASQKCDVGADGQAIDARPVELIASQREEVVAEKSDERFQILAVRGHRVDGDVALVSEVIEEIADLVFHARRSLAGSWNAL